MCYTIHVDALTLRPEAQVLVNRLINSYQPEKLIIFGSFARGEAKEESDLDICLIKKDVPASSVERRFEVYKILEGRKIPVDIIVYQPSEFETRLRLGDPFIKSILEEGQVIYG